VPEYGKQSLSVATNAENIQMNSILKRITELENQLVDGLIKDLTAFKKATRQRRVKMLVELDQHLGNLTRVVQAMPIPSLAPRELRKKLAREVDLRGGEIVRETSDISSHKPSRNEGA
jgi:hypothetical protein